MFGKFNFKNTPPLAVQELVEREDKDFQEKFKEFWEKGTYYDIYNKIKDGDCVTLSVARMSKDDYNKLVETDSMDNYLKERSLCDYIGQYPHKHWRFGIQEYEIYSKVFKNEPESVFTKTDYFPEKEVILFHGVKRLFNINV